MLWNLYLSEPKIGEFEDGLILVKVAVQEVLRLEVTMHDVVVVAIKDRLRHLYDAISCLVLRVVILPTMISVPPVR